MTMERQSSNIPLIGIEQAAAQELAYIKGRRSGEIKSLKTPWEKFNRASMDGIEWGSIITIAGMSGSGKTTIVNELETGLFELNLTEDFAVLSFNYEMIARKLVGRKISKYLGKSVKQLYSADDEQNISDEEIAQITRYVETLNKYPIYYIDVPGTVNEIENIIMQFHADNPSKKIIVSLDHSILIKKMPGQNQIDALYDLGAMFTKVKKIPGLHISFIILSQLNRDIEKVERKQDKRLHYPQKSDIFGAKKLAQY